MSEDIDAKIAGFDGSYNGLEAKSLFIEGILKRHSKYYCYICGVNLIQNNVEKYLDEHIKRKPYFRCKDTDPHQGQDNGHGPSHGCHRRNISIAY